MNIILKEEILAETSLGAEYKSEVIARIERLQVEVAGSPILKEAVPMNDQTESPSMSPCPSPPSSKTPPPAASLHSSPVLVDDPIRSDFLVDM